MTSVGCVVLSMGTRPVELRRALDSVVRQRDVEVSCLVVGNGWEPVGLPAGVGGHALAENVGVPEGRNIGAAHVRGDLLLFLDDDAVLVGDDFLARAVAAFDADPKLAVVQPRAVSDRGASARRHVPRLGGSGPERAGDVAWFWEGCSLLRRSAFDAAGQWPGHFFYGHEGIELAWRVIDGGGRIRYAADLVVRNPEAAPFRGERHRYLDARNRVWVARRNLPVLLIGVYVGVWAAVTLGRSRSVADTRSALRGFVDGFRQGCGARRRIRWVTVWRLTVLGRPPIV